MFVSKYLLVALCSPFAFYNTVVLALSASLAMVLRDIGVHMLTALTSTHGLQAVLYDMTHNDYHTVIITINHGVMPRVWLPYRMKVCSLKKFLLI